MIFILGFIVSQKVMVIAIQRFCGKQQFIRLQSILLWRPAVAANDGF
jgi:hypothetical protein